MLTNMSWGQAFQLIDTFNPPPDKICSILQITPDELRIAQALRDAGTLAPDLSFKTSKYKDVFNVSSESTEIVTIQAQSATKKVAIKAPQKRGRKGDKIIQALLAVPKNPVDANKFATEHSISLAVLRQAKRFIINFPEDIIEQIGTIKVRQDKTTKILMVWKE